MEYRAVFGLDVSQQTGDVFRNRSIFVSFFIFLELQLVELPQLQCPYNHVRMSVSHDNDLLI